MARKYVLDTNIYIDAVRDATKEQELEKFLERNAPMTYTSAVVLQELRAGAVTDAQAKALQDGLFPLSVAIVSLLPRPRRSRSAGASWPPSFGKTACHIESDPAPSSTIS
jgi:predicted nucleic acid-binding protein